MYIIYDSMNPEDPRLAKVTRYYDYWMYTIGYVNSGDESSFDLAALPAIVIPEAVAKASRFSKLNIGKNGYTIKFRMDINGSQEMFPDYSGNSSEFPDHTKLVYELTDSDIENVVIFLKTIMSFELERHYAQLTAEESAQYTAKRVEIQAEIDACTDILACNLLMHNRFGIEAHNHVAEEHLDCGCTFDLSVPKLEIRSGTRREWR